jgi:uncharacterized membrane protein
VNLFDGVDRSDRSNHHNPVQPANNNDNSNHYPTLAVVTLTISIEGDSTMLPTIKTRAQLRDAFSRIAADAQVEDCLLGGEVLWAPEGTTEVMTEEEVLADYPDLMTIL